VGPLHPEGEKLMSKFKSKPDSTNRELIDMQKAEAARAEAKEAARQARLKYGREQIEATFNGGTVNGLPTTGTRDVWQADPLPSAGSTLAGSILGMGGSGGARPVTTGRAPNVLDVFGMGGPSGARPVATTTPTRPGKFVKETYEIPGQAQTYGGIGQDFYENFRKSLEGFYRPDAERQFDEARGQNLFDLARKGLLRSSTSVKRAEDLVRDKSAADARLGSEIEGQVTGLRGDVNAAKQRAYGLLTSTEDPTTAANSALTEVNAIQTRKPSFNALGDLFASALNSYSTFRNAQSQREQLAGLPTRSPSASSGRTYQ
jgi:hypothetical protein